MTPFLSFLITIVVVPGMTVAAVSNMKQGAVRVLTMLVLLLVLSVTIPNLWIPVGDDDFGYAMGGLLALVLGLPLTIILLIILDQRKNTKL